MIFMRNLLSFARKGHVLVVHVRRLFTVAMWCVCRYKFCYIHNMCMNLAFDVDDFNIFFLLRVEICLLAVLHSYFELYSKRSGYSCKLSIRSSSLILLSTKFC